MNSTDFFNAYLQHEPEEATLLGLPQHAGRWRSAGLSGLQERTQFFATALETLQAPGDPTEQDLRDLACARRLCALEVDRLLSDDALSNPEWAMHAFAVLQWQQLTDGPDVAERLAGLPRYLERDRQRLRHGLAQGAVCHPGLLSWLGEHALPSAARGLASLDARAAQAYADHAAFYRHTLLPRAQGTGSMGAETYARRWRLTFGDRGPSIDTLVEQAWAALHDLDGDLLAAVRAVDADVQTVGQAMAWAQQQQHETLPPGTDVQAHYRALLERTAAFVEEQGLFHIGDALETLRLDGLPEGLRDNGVGTNWPAPLKAPARPGQFLLHPEPGCHPAAWAAVLAVHEGVPGHFLQSWAWQRRFADHPAPVSFLLVHDDAAIARRAFHTMPCIEGYAVHAEEVVRQAGLHTGRDAVFAVMAHRLRAVRVLTDIGFHRGTLDADSVARLVHEQIGAPLASARGEANRVARCGLQAVTYFAGAQGLATMARRRPAEQSLADFHDGLFDRGTEPPW